MHETQQFATYLRRLAAGAVGILLLTGTLTFLVNPYYLFGTPAVSGVTELKPQVAERGRLAKPYMIERHQPVTIIGGNSRAEMGLSPDSLCWLEQETPVFNAGLPGASIHLQLALVKHAIAVAPVSHVYLGIDFPDFLSQPFSSPPRNAGPLRLSESFARLSTNVTGGSYLHYARRRTEDRLTALFSLDAVADSLFTTIRQHNAVGATRYANGFNPANDYLPIIRHEGQEVLFAQKMAEIRASFSQPGLRFVQHSVDESPVTPAEALASFLESSRRANVKVTLILAPYHNDYLSAIQEAGLGGELGDWLNWVASLSRTFSVVTWDFLSKNPLIHEAVPAPGDRSTELNWFWEPAHYKRELGELMLSRMLDRPCAPEMALEVHQSIGTRLN